MLWIRLALLHLSRNKVFALFFIFNLAMGLAGFISVLSLSRSMNHHMTRNLKEVLTADLEISSPSALSKEEQEALDEILGKDALKAKLIRMFTMARPEKGEPRLVEIMAIDGNYPLYGSFRLLNEKNTGVLQRLPTVFMSKDTADSFGFDFPSHSPQVMMLGGKAFELKDLFSSDPDTSISSYEFAPRVFVGIKQLEGTGLIKFGSRVRHSLFYRFSDDTDVPELTQKLRKQIAQRFPGPPRMRINDTNDVNNRISRMITYYIRFMALTGITSLFLSATASSYLFRGYLSSRKKDIAVLLSLGAQKPGVSLSIGLELLIMGGLASLVSILISLALIPAFPILLKGLVPSATRFSMDMFTLVLGIFMGMGGSFIFCLPLFIRIFNIRPLTLLRNIPVKFSSSALRLPAVAASFLPILAGFFYVSSHLTRSVADGLIFVSGFSLILMILSGLGALVFYACRPLSQSLGSMVRKIAFRNLMRNKWSSVSCFVSIAMGSFLISVIPQIQKGLHAEISKPEGLKVPEYLIVDIQEEQKTSFVNLMKKLNADLSNISPIVRGRILKKNSQPFQESVASGGPKGQDLPQQPHRVEFNFSHRDGLDPSESIAKGPPLSQATWDFESGTPFEVSVEISFAERYRIGLGDVLLFEVQGIPMEGRVVNFRKVRWNSFQPNFYLLFQDGVLNDAPKTYLASVSHETDEKRKEMKQKITMEFPNVSILDVIQIAGRVLSISDRFSTSVRFMAWFSMITGLVLIYSIARYEALKNQNQINLLKVLGASFPMIRAITLLEFGFIGLTAGVCGIGLSFLGTFILAWYFFDSLFQFDFNLSILLLALITLISMGTALAASGRVLLSKPAELFRNGV